MKREFSEECFCENPVFIEVIPTGARRRRGTPAALTVPDATGFLDFPGNDACCTFARAN
jgi:hypothetical protein